MHRPAMVTDVTGLGDGAVTRGAERCCSDAERRVERGDESNFGRYRCDS
jgi:hypothetical protein